MRPELPESHSEALLALAVVGSLPGVQVQRVASCREIWRLLLGRRRIWAKWAMQVRLMKNPLCSVIHVLAVLADADPLGVNQNVTFDEVGGLDDRESSDVHAVTRT